MPDQSVRFPDRAAFVAGSSRVDAAPEGHEWLHEIKFGGYRMPSWVSQQLPIPLSSLGVTEAAPPF